ncbi:MAG: response regulator transcription factor [Chloroflexota bacterium]
MSKVLVVEDDPTLQETVSYNLKREGYVVEVVGDGQAAIEKASQWKPDLILLDLMLPKVHGHEVCRAVRQEMNIPILMLTARDEEIDRVLGLEIGADDYITKPFSMRELLARVKAHLRHDRRVRADVGTPAATTPKNIISFGNLAINLTRREAYIDDQPMALKPKEYDLLLFLAEHRGHALTREFLLERVWGWEVSVDTRTVDVHIHWLREKIEPDPGRPNRIITVRGAGYRFEG